MSPVTPLLNDTAILPLLLALIVLSIVGWIRVPIVAGLARLGSLAVVALVLILVTGQRDRFEPYIGRLLAPLERDAQAVVGEEVRLQMSPDGHFWANVRLDGVERRMLVDSGATITAISDRTAREIGLDAAPSPIPVLIRTANGTVAARSGRVDELRLGNIKAGGLGVVVSPAFGDVDVLGMNFLSKLKSWRVEGRTLILTPNHPQPVTDA
ncbi:TIGR02281 family clan AA aspartic protease [Sphingomonas lenta]|uniref:TIGR02281 family clan AA aspartic protease n=1 Tax=Sphingomonas lenta TaxID=1141887 RepID=A0A2A2SFM9_9SPHN|nr:TIGR02281 family clan AA aspartic protease [Sphingomonas lenta]PAX08066.1 TIGR02281 family clan AA aspartic protease [Sphingomonas lenta]